MACLFSHDWGWPRKRGNRHMQVCLTCGKERESLVKFDGPRYRKTQEADEPVEFRRQAGERLPLPSVA